jgi:hypothetical protein
VTSIDFATSGAVMSENSPPPRRGSPRGMLLALARALVPQCERRNASTDELIGSELLFVRLGPGVMPCVGLGLVAK